MCVHSAADCSLLEPVISACDMIAVGQVPMLMPNRAGFGAIEFVSYYVHAALIVSVGTDIWAEERIC